MEDIVELYKGQISSHEAGTLLESVPAPGINFSSSIYQKRDQKIEQTPGPSPNPSPF